MISDESDSTIESVDSRVPIDGLFNPENHYPDIQHEQPEHRLMLYLSAQGATVPEIARQTSYSESWIYRVRAQKWFKDRFVQLCHDAGKDPVEQFIKSEGLPALQRVVDLARHADKDATKLAANQEILNRFLGKPVVSIRSENKTDLTVIQKDASAIDTELADLEARLRTHGVN